MARSVGFSDEFRGGVYRRIKLTWEALKLVMLGGITLRFESGRLNY